MKFTIDKKILFGYLSAFALLVFSYLLLFSTSDKIVRQSAIADAAKDNIYRFEKLYSSVKTMESGYNGYLLSGKDEYLKTYTAAKISTDSSIKIMSLILPGNIAQANNFKTLYLLINTFTGTLNKGIAYMTAGDKSVDTAKNFSYAGKKIADSISQKIEQMKDSESVPVNKNEHEPAKTSDALKVINFTSMVIAILIAIYSLNTYTRENKARRKADEQSVLYRQQLEQRIEELNIASVQLNELKNIEKFAATGRMARMIAHEVRNPLTNIGLANDQLKDTVEPNEESSMLLTMIKRNGERINHLIGDLLDATKFVELNCTEFFINELLDEVLLAAQDRIILSNIKIQKNYAPDQPKIVADKEKIKMALLNIIINATEAVEPAKGVIEITSSCINKMCRIMIKDNGAGMNEETLSKLFEPFFTKKDKGNGLGLTNTQNIILNHKGNIKVESKPYQGTLFILNLPYIA